jgi:hypothetical protein
VSRSLFKLCAAFGVAHLIIGLVATPATAIGYWNVPGNVCQCWGYGNGAGYHAPLVLGPVSLKGCLAHNEVRLPYAPAPPYCWTRCGGSESCCEIGEPSMLESEALPGPTRAAAPVTPTRSLAPDSATYRVPFRY